MKRNHPQLCVHQWSIPLVSSTHGHAYVLFNIPSSSHLANSQLQKLYCQFLYQSAEKSLNLIGKAHPEHGTPEARKVLRDISRSCEPCERIRPASTRFRVYFGTKKVRFNERILMDVMYIDDALVLRIVDEATHFSEAFLPDCISTKAIAKALLRCWGTIYTTIPNRIRTDRSGKSIRGKCYVHLHCYTSERRSSMYRNRSSFKSRNA